MFRKMDGQGADQGTAVVSQTRGILKSPFGIEGDVQSVYVLIL